MPCCLNCCSRCDERFAVQVESFVNVLQPFGRHRLDADERALDARLAHRIEEFGILRGFHRDLREEVHVARQLREPRHQLEPLGAQRLQLVQPTMIGAARGLLEIFQRDGIEVVVGERDEPEPAAPQLHDLLEHRVDAALTRLLAVGLPHGAERAMLRTAAHGLHRRPHVAIGRQQIPARPEEMLGVDFSAFVHLVVAAQTALDGLAPRDVAVALDDGVAAAESMALPDRAWRECRRTRPRRRGRARAARPRIRAGHSRVDADPTTSPAAMVDGSNCSRVSSVMSGSPYSEGVAAAKT